MAIATGRICWSTRRPGAVSGILDFGDMIHAPRILEPAVTMSELLTEGLAPLAGVSAVLEGYALRQPLEGAEIEVAVRSDRGTPRL